MSAQAALSVVSQIQTLANGPKTTEMRAHLGQVVSSLQFFLDHPDSRVRLGSAKTLVQLAGNYADDMKHLDLAKIRGAIVNAERKEADGSDPCAPEQLQLLTQAMGMIDGKKAPAAAALPAAAEEDRNAAAGTAFSPEGSMAAAYGGNGFSIADDAEESAQLSSAVVQRGEVVLKVAAGDDRKAQVSVLQAVVAVAGVVSVTVEGPHVVVNTRTAEHAGDPVFHRELLRAIEVSGLTGVTIAQDACASAVAGNAGLPLSSPALGAGRAVEEFEMEDMDEPGYLDDDEEDDYDDQEAGAVGAAGSSSSTSAAVPGGGIAGAPGSGFKFSSGFGGPPGGLGGSAGPGSAQWSFFAQTNWMTGRQVLEFDNDPTIAARLQRVKARQEEKRQEEKSTLGRLTSWLGR